jgi:hypothetical protein
LVVTAWDWQRRLSTFQNRELVLPVGPTSAVFVLSPVALVLLTLSGGPWWFAQHLYLVLLALAALFLATGWRGRWAPWVALGAALGTIGTTLALQPRLQGTVGIAVALLVVVLVATDRLFDQRGARAPALAWAGFQLLPQIAPSGLPLEVDPAFTGWSAMVLYALLACLWISARAWRTLPGERQFTRLGRPLLLVFFGLAALGGGSIQLLRFFALTAETARIGAVGLAGDLALSIYWIVFAGVLLWLGFRRDARAVRAAGLGLAVITALKIGLHDVSRLSALFRVASVAGLALLALGAAWTYQRRMKAQYAAVGGTAEGGTG